MPRPQRPRRARLAARRRPRLREAGRGARQASAAAPRSSEVEEYFAPLRAVPRRSPAASPWPAGTRPSPQGPPLAARPPEPRSTELGSLLRDPPGSSSFVSSSALSGGSRSGRCRPGSRANALPLGRVHVAVGLARPSAPSSGRVASTSARVSLGSRPVAGVEHRLGRRLAGRRRRPRCRARARR